MVPFPGRPPSFSHLNQGVLENRGSMLPLPAGLGFVVGAEVANKATNIDANATEMSSVLTE